MLKSNEDLIAELKIVLAGQRYHPRTISNYCGCALRFLDYLERRKIQVENVTEALVSNYISHASGMLRKRHGRSGPHQHPTRAPEFMRCCGLCRPVAPLRKQPAPPRPSDLRSATNTRSGFVRREALPPPASRL